MPQPKASPTPSPAPSGTQTHRHTPGMPMPAASPSPGAMSHMEGMHDMSPLVVMNGEDMEIRVGSSDTNLISMGTMGSGIPNRRLHIRWSS